ncbi:hypothetical protein CSUI_010552, partial [Cystoisospora suis]
MLLRVKPTQLSTMREESWHIQTSNFFSLQVRKRSFLLPRPSPPEKQIIYHDLPQPDVPLEYIHQVLLTPSLLLHSLPIINQGQTISTKFFHDCLFLLLS